MEIVINKCFGGFGLSDKAYEKMIEYGIPVQRHYKQERDPKTHLYQDQPLNNGEVIYDRELTPAEEDDFGERNYRGLWGRYWDSWIDKNRTHPILIRVIKELGEEANGRHAELNIVEIPEGVDWEIDEYDGMEHVAESHGTWG